MLSKAKKLFSHSVVYGLGNMSAKLVGFLLIPIYTRYLTTEDYGLLSLCTMFSVILYIFFNVGSSSAIFRSYFLEDTEQGGNSVITTVFFLNLIVSLPIAVLLLLNSGWLAKLLLGSVVYKNAIILAIFVTFFNLIVKFPLLVMRLKEESKKYSVSELSKTLLTTVCALLFVVGFRKGFIGVLLAQAIGGIVFCFILIPMTLRSLPLKFSMDTAKELLSFGLPLVPAGLATFVITLSDRLFLKHYATLHEVGLYSLGYRFGELLLLFTWAFQIAWPQFLFANKKDPDAKQLYSRITTYYVGVIGFLCLGVSILSKDIIKIMATPSFFDAHKVVPLIAISLLINGLITIGTLGINLKKKTGWLPLTVGIAAVTNISLNYLWIPKYGMMGAALATLISYLVQCLLSVSISLKYYPMSYEYGRLVKIVFISFGFYFVSQAIVHESTVVAVIYKVLLLCLYPVGLFVLGFFNDQESAYAQQLFIKIRSKKIMTE